MSTEKTEAALGKTLAAIDAHVPDTDGARVVVASVRELVAAVIADSNAAAMVAVAEVMGRGGR